jgi:hypothetical protein
MRMQRIQYDVSGHPIPAKLAALIGKEISLLPENTKLKDQSPAFAAVDGWRWVQYAGCPDKYLQIHLKFKPKQYADPTMVDLPPYPFCDEPKIILLEMVNNMIKRLEKKTTEIADCDDSDFVLVKNNLRKLVKIQYCRDSNIKVLDILHVPDTHYLNYGNRIGLDKNASSQDNIIFNNLNSLVAAFIPPKVIADFNKCTPIPTLSAKMPGLQLYAFNKSLEKFQRLMGPYNVRNPIEACSDYFEYYLHRDLTNSPESKPVSSKKQTQIK